MIPKHESEFARDYLHRLQARDFKHIKLVTTYFCIGTPIPKRKWLWVFFVLVGIGSIGIDWSTGQLGVQPVSIKIFGASAITASPFAPG